MDDDIFLPLVIATGMFAVVYAGVSMGEYQGHAFHSKCIEECYDCLLYTSDAADE